MKDNDLRLFCELHHQISTFSPMKASSLEELRPDLGGLRSSRLGDGSNAVSILAASDPQVVHGGPMVAPAIGFGQLSSEHRDPKIAV